MATCLVINIILCFSSQRQIRAPTVRRRVRLRTTRVVVSVVDPRMYPLTTVVISDRPTVRGIRSPSCSTRHYYNIGFESADKHDHL